MNRFLYKKIPNDDALINEIYRLRYKVYCDEWGFEKPEDHPGGIEYDEFDKHSVHIAALSSDAQELIGTIRIILSSELGFPMERHCRIGSDLSYLDRNKIGEISRLAVSKEYRRRAGDRLIYDGGESAKVNNDQSVYERRKNEFAIITGLYTYMYKESLAMGLTHWYAVMAKGLNILLQRMGIMFKSIGPEVDYHGLRTPYLGVIDEIAMKVSRENTDFIEACGISADVDR